MGCQMEVVVEDGEIKSIENYSCQRGVEYAKKEITNPKRTITSILPVVGGDLSMVSVKTSADIPKDKISACMRVMKDLSVNAPIMIGDVIVKNICDTGIDIIATKKVEKKE
jgi:CxxC motif-containing protein